MIPPEPESWTRLFAAGQPEEARKVVPVRVLRRQGEPFLVLPAEARLAATSLGLYAPQSLRARMGRTALRWALAARCAVTLPRTSIAIAREDLFADFLCRVAGTAATDCPAFAVLAGNPRVAGRRFILLVFDPTGRPAAVVKAGVEADAQRRVDREAAFLLSVPSGVAGVPRVRARHESALVHAFAMDFFAGRSPGLEDSDLVGQLLTSWIDSSRTVRLCELPVWKICAEAAGGSPGTRSLDASLGEKPVRPVIFHGDFAPWNIRVANRQPRAVDWERGEPAGVPGWDWFHFVIQSAVLVRREPLARLATRVEELLASPQFQGYAERARITGLEKLLVIAYLSHCLHVLRQTEGLERIGELLGHLRRRWFRA